MSLRSRDGYRFLTTAISALVGCSTPSASTSPAPMPDATSSPSTPGVPPADGSAPTGALDAGAADASASAVDGSSASPISTGSHVAMDDLEVPDPFTSWANAMTSYGARGDGQTDDAPALQAALNDLGRNGKAGVLYLPPGTYLLKSTVTFTGTSAPMGVSIVGDTPQTTIVKWAGPSGAAMLLQNGGFNVSYSRMTFDGQKTAGYGIAQWWNTTTQDVSYGGSSEHVDMIFEDMGIGIMGGRLGADYGQLDSEGQVRRVTFLRMTYAGVDTGSFNALDWWVFDSHFVDCARGVTNTFSLDDSGTTSGAGAFYLYRNLFEGSTIADVQVGNTGWFSMHENVSLGSAQFFASADMGSGCEIIIEGNRIVGTTNPVSIYNGNMGNLIVIDNQIRSATDSATPIESTSGWDINGSDVFSAGNQFTVAPANYVKHESSLDRIVSIGDTTVAASAISTTAPSLPGTPSRVTRQVFEVPSGATGAQIQTAIDAAAMAASAGVPDPIVHLPPGAYSISASLVVPAQTRMQIVGDSFGTQLNWVGAKGGTVFLLPGPSYATIRNLYLFLNWQLESAASFTLTEADQPGGRIFVEGSVVGGITASNLAQTQISAQENTGIGQMTLDHVANLSAVGLGGLGPVTATSSGVTVLDTWYEGTDSQLYRLNGGTFTLLGAQLNPASHQPATLPIVPAIALDSFAGTASFLGVVMNSADEPGGIAVKIGAETAQTNALFLGLGAATFERTSSGGNVGLISPRQSNSLGQWVPAPAEGTQTPSFVNEMLAQSRALLWDTAPYVAPAGATDVRIYRVHMGPTSGIVATGD